MTDRVNALVVALSEDMRDDDPALEDLMCALRQLRFVETVSHNVASSYDTWVGYERARSEFLQKTMNLYKEI